MILRVCADLYLTICVCVCVYLQDIMSYVCEWCVWFVCISVYLYAQKLGLEGNWMREHRNCVQYSSSLKWNNLFQKKFYIKMYVYTHFKLIFGD